MMLEQGRRRLRISDGCVPGGMACRKIDVIEIHRDGSRARRGSSSKYKTGRGAIRGRFVERVLSERFGRSHQLVLISTSLVSGRKKKPTTAVIDAKMIGYHRPA